MQQVDTIIHPEWVIPVSGDKTYLNEYSVAILADKIHAVAPRRDIEQTFESSNILELPNQVLMPGLVNSHAHSAMALMRGLADDLPLMTWLQDHIWPAEQQHVSPAFVEQGTLLACAEMIRGGTTTFNDMYFFPEATARAALTAKMRAHVGVIVIEFPSAYAQNAEEYIQNGLACVEAFQNEPLIGFTLSPHAPYTVSDESLTKLNTLKAQLQLPVHIHLHETAFEVQDAIEKNGLPPIQRLKSLGLLDEKLIAVHMTALDDEAIAAVAESGASVIHCPESNMKLASGICPTAKLTTAGVNVCLGTDGAASNNDLDMFGEMRAAAMLAKVSTGDATALPALEVIKMATINGAKALGLAEQIGSIEVGKQADIITVDLDSLHTAPVYNPVSQIVFTATAQDVTHVWCNGHLLLQDRELTSINIADLKANVAEWRQKISSTDHAEH